jgi:D-glycero-D-manno-heptose 1,7-bisphosphate phosphatase
MAAARKAGLFLDRDGVVNEEDGHLADPARVVLVPGAARAIATMNALGVPVIVVTNQGGRALGLISDRELVRVTERLHELLGAEGARLDAVYICPHHPRAPRPSDRTCRCRKPDVGLLQRAARDHELALHRSVVVGDRWTDLQAARVVGAAAVLVRTGRGAATHARLAQAGDLALVAGVFETLGDAAPWLAARFACDPRPSFA